MRGSSTVQKMLGSSTIIVYSEAVVFHLLSKMAVAVCRFGAKVICKMTE
jgi:hypothetical protein